MSGKEDKVGLTLEAIRAAADAAAKKALEARNKTDDDNKKKSDKEARYAEEDAKINEMSRADFANMIFNRITEHLTEAVGASFQRMSTAYDERFKGLDALLAERQVGEAEKEPFFADFKEDVAAKMQERPGLSPLEALRLVKAEKPEKLTELSTKADAAAKEKAASEKRPFGGFFPTNGVSTAKDTSKMTPAEAADAAWQATMADIPASLFTEPVQ